MPLVLFLAKILENMKKNFITMILSTFLSVSAYSQDTFSTLVVDNLTMTVYSAVESQTDSNPKTTASGQFIVDPYNPPNYIAVSRDLLCSFPFGSEVEVDCGGCVYEGVYFVEDVMNIRYSNSIDILISPYGQIGKWWGVSLTLLN